MRRRTGSALLAFSFTGALLLAAGCAALNPLPEMGFNDLSREEKAIAVRIQPFTGRVEVYREFSTVFTARALYLSPEVRRMAAAWEVKSRLLDPQEAESLERGAVAPGLTQVEFLLGFYTPQEGKNRLEDPAGEWKAFLQLSNGSLVRASCFSVDPADANLYMRFLRWDLSWSRLYRLCFPVRPDDPSLLSAGMTLVISGPSGRGEMVFPPAPKADP